MGNRFMVKQFFTGLPLAVIISAILLFSGCTTAEPNTSPNADTSNTPSAADTTSNNDSSNVDSGTPDTADTTATDSAAGQTETVVDTATEPEPVPAMEFMLTPIEQLGRNIMFDTNLSSPPGMSCTTCHAPEAGFAGPDSQTNLETAVYPGAVHTRFGNRKPPTAAYGGDSPNLHYDADDDVWVGGMFFDGRATGMTLDDPLAEQAQGPFVNLAEHNVIDMETICFMVSQSDYADLFEEVWGAGSTDYTKNVQEMYDRIAYSISAFEQSSEVSQFTSKFDAWEAGEYTMTELEALGKQLFEDPEKGNCAACHPAPLFTDFTYDNLGVPKNPDLPFYNMAANLNPDGADFIDTGLGGFLMSQGYEEDEYMAQWGKVKVPTLRNVDKRPDADFIKAYAHNGFFKSLEDIVHFYNTRDIASENWPEPEVALNVNGDELGDLGLTVDEEMAIVAFLQMLSDGYWVPGN